MRHARHEKDSLHLLLRGIILTGFALLIFKLIVTGTITNYIAPKMVVFAYITLFTFMILGPLLIIRATGERQRDANCGCGENHFYPDSVIKSIFLYLLFIIPITFGFLFSSNLLDSSVVMKRQINLGAQNDGEGETQAETESLDRLAGEEPISKEEYSLLEKDLLQGNHIDVADKHYVPIMDVINQNLDKVVGKTVSIKGFVYREPNFFTHEMIVARFGITCCVADASVYGLMAKGDVEGFEADTWVEVAGVLEKMKYEGSNIPVISITDIKEIPVPKQPYVNDAGIQLE